MDSEAGLAGGVVISLFGREALAKDAGDEPGHGFAGLTLSQNVTSRDEVDAIVPKAALHGGRVLKSPRETFWGGYAGYFADPDGHVWEIAWNPGVELLANGEIRLPVG